MAEVPQSRQPEAEQLDPRSFIENRAERLDATNAFLASRNLRPFKNMGNWEDPSMGTELFEIRGVYDTTKRFYTVVTFGARFLNPKPEEQRGPDELSYIPGEYSLIFKANGQAADGNVYVARIHSQDNNTTHYAFVNQFRIALGEREDGLPRGFASEDDLESAGERFSQGIDIAKITGVNALRELSNETGITNIKMFQHLGKVAEDSSTSASYANVYLVDLDSDLPSQELIQKQLAIQQRLDTSETGLTVVLRTGEEVYRRIGDRQINDMHSLSALLTAAFQDKWEGKRMGQFLLRDQLAAQEQASAAKDEENALLKQENESLKQELAQKSAAHESSLARLAYNTVYPLAGFTVMQSALHFLNHATQQHKANTEAEARRKQEARRNRFNNGDGLTDLLRGLHAKNIPVHPWVVKIARAKRAEKSKEGTYSSPVAKDGYIEDSTVVKINGKNRSIWLRRRQDLSIEQAQALDRNEFIERFLGTVEKGDSDTPIFDEYYVTSSGKLSSDKQRVHELQIDQINIDENGDLKTAKVKIRTDKGETEVQFYKDPADMVRDGLNAATEGYVALENNGPQAVFIKFNGRLLHLYHATPDLLKEAASTSAENSIVNAVADQIKKFPDLTAEKGYFAVDLANERLHQDENALQLAWNRDGTAITYGFPIK